MDKCVSTKDRDNDVVLMLNSAELFTGAWWYSLYISSSLNGQYHFEPFVSDGYGLIWTEYNKSLGYSMKETKMLIKANSTTDNLITSLPCLTRPIASLPLNFSSNNCDPCLGESSVMCKNGSEIDIVPDFCECAAGGIWTIIQKRFDGSVDFYRNWTDYKNDFGDLNGEYWLGNDVIHQITSSANYTLKIYLTDWDNVTKYAMYDTFRIADEADGYRLTIGGYSGDAGDSMSDHHNGQMFSTKDRDNDVVLMLNSAELFTGAWWYSLYISSSLNGQYHVGPFVSDGYGLIWTEYNESLGYSMKETKMLIKAN